MDDADGGRRGPRARAAAELLRTIQDRYGFGTVGRWTDLGGSSSLNLLVEAGGRRYVARVYRPHVAPGRLRAIHLARAALRAGGVPCAPPIGTVDGAPWVDVDGRLVEVEGYVDNDAAMDSWERLDAGMAMLGRTHAVLRGVETGEPGRRPPFANHVGPAEVVAATRRGAARIRGWGPTAPEARLASAAEELAARVAAAEAGLAVPPPRQLVHGDFWDNNVLFRGGRVVLVGDLEFMGERARVDDLALTLWFAEADLPPAVGLAARLARLRRLLDRYDAGADPPLSGAERAALPLALARQPLWSIGGWVARPDDQGAARRHAAGAEPSVRAALGLLDDLDRWRDALA